VCREYAAGKDAAKKMADMLARAAAAMAEVLECVYARARKWRGRGGFRV